MNRRGWSVIELIIVCVIIAIIVVVVVPAYTQAIEQSRCGKATQTLSTLRDAQFDFYAENESFTPNIADLRNFIGLAVNLNDPNWTFAVVAGNVTTFTLQATRLSGSWAGRIITLNQDEVWGGTYPINGPW